MFDFERARALRLGQRRRQEDVARMAGIERRRYGLIERGLQPDLVEELPRIAAALGVDVSELLQTPMVTAALVETR